MTRLVGMVIGSLRKASMSRRIAKELIGVAPKGSALNEIVIGDLPLYNGDLEQEPPPEWLRLRSEVLAADALLFVIPEYNRSVPGAVKNAIDIASKPTAKNCWSGKPALVISQSTGPLGGLAGSYALKQTLLAVNAAVMPHPEVYLSRIADVFGAQGQMLSDPREHLRDVLGKFDTWITRFEPR